MKVIPFSYLIFNKFNKSSKWFFNFTNEKTPIFAPYVPLATAISFAYQTFLIVMRLILKCVLTLIIVENKCTLIKVALRMGYFNNCYTKF